MRLVHVVIGKVNTHKMNGVNKVVHELASSQVILGHKVTVWGITKNTTHTYSERKYLTVLFKDNGPWKLLCQVKNKLEDEPKNAIFHFHGGFIWQFCIIARLLHRRGYNYVLTPHGSYNTIAMQRSYFKKQLFSWLFEGFLVSHAKAIHFIGESEILGALPKFRIKNYALIPNGEKVKSVLKSDQRQNNNPVIIGFCGRLDVKTKGLDLLLKGVALYTANSKENFKIWLIGDGEQKQQLQKLAQELDISKYLVFHGSKFGNEKEELFKQLKFFILTSRNEGMPGVVLEAAAMGIPCIVSEPTNMAKYIVNYQSGIFIESNSPQGICDALHEAFIVLRKEQYSQMSKNATQMVETEFDWLEITRKIILLYES